MAEAHDAPGRPSQPPHGARASLDVALDLREHGASRDGEPQVLDRRLFMQLLVLGVAGDPRPTESSKHLMASLTRAGMGAVIYEDVNDPFGIGLLTFSEDPSDFVTKVRPAVAEIGRASCRERV